VLAFRSCLWFKSIPYRRDKIQMNVLIISCNKSIEFALDLDELNKRHCQSSMFPESRRLNRSLSRVEITFLASSHHIYRPFASIISVLRIYGIASHRLTTQQHGWMPYHGDCEKERADGRALCYYNHHTSCWPELGPREKSEYSSLNRSLSHVCCGASEISVIIWLKKCFMFQKNICTL
jgi:hypothetical protein